MRLIDRYLLRELVGTFGAVFVVLLLTSASGVLVDLLRRIALGKVPAALLLSQFGLRLVDVLPMLIPLALFIGVLLTYSRLYRDSEMAVLASAGQGLNHLLRPAALLVGVVATGVAVLSLWAAPAAMALSKRMIDEANRSLLVAGLEPGRFVELPGRHSVVYLGGMSSDGSRFQRLFVHSERDGRVDVVTAAEGELFTEALGEERYLGLRDGFRVEGVPGQADYRVMHFERNDIRVPDSEPGNDRDRDRRIDTLRLIADEAPTSRAELHWRLAAPIAAALLALLAIPLSRSPPRSARYGSLLLAVLGYLVYLNCLLLGRAWIGDGSLPGALGLWWVHAPVLLLGVLLLRRADRLPRRKATPA